VACRNRLNNFLGHFGLDIKFETCGETGSKRALVRPRACAAMPSPKMSGVPRGPPPAADKPRDAIYVAPPPKPITEYLKSDLRPDNWDSEILHGFCMGHMGKQGYEDWKELKRLQQVDRGENKTWSYKRSDTDGFKGNDSNYTAQQDTPYGAGGTVAMAVMNGIGTDPTRAGAAKSLQRGRDLTQVSKSELMAHQEEEKQKHLSRYTNSHWIQSAELASRSDEKSSKVDVYQWPARDKRYTPPTKFVAQVEQFTRSRAPKDVDNHLYTGAVHKEAESEQEIIARKFANNEITLDGSMGHSATQALKDEMDNLRRSRSATWKDKAVASQSNSEVPL